MKRFLFVTGLISLLSIQVYAAKTKVESVPAGNKIVNIVFDNGIDDKLDGSQVKAQNQIGDFMKADLVRVIARYAKQGYEGKLLAKKEEYKKGENNYLLLVKIAHYNAGNKAARMFVGYGAGGVKLEIAYELMLNGKSLIKKDDGVYSGRDWRNAARKLNENLTKDIVEKTNK